MACQSSACTSAIRTQAHQAGAFNNMVASERTRLPELAPGYSGTLIIIPTRNRADIAINAIKSILDQPVDTVELMVSDNSTDHDEAERLSTYCRELGDRRVRYVRPPSPLSMTPHWEWAMQLGLSSCNASHFIYLTDRLMFKAGAVSDLINIAVNYPDKVISYAPDQILDSDIPAKVDHRPFTGKVLEVECAHLLSLCANHLHAIIHPALPRMLNCMAPRAVLDGLFDRFGNVFSSIAPDYNFCFRCLYMADSILYYDRALIFDYALERSHGASVTRGEMTADNVDFVACLAADNLTKNYATPVPDLNTSVNAAFHEYFVVRDETGSPRFPDVDMQNYLRANAEEVRGMIDPKVRQEMTRLLTRNGYDVPAAAARSAPRPDSFMARLSRLVSVGRSKIGLVFKSRMAVLVTRPGTTRFWLYIARRFGVAPPADNRFVFHDLEDAIDYVRNLSPGKLRKRYRGNDFLMGREKPVSLHKRT